MKFILLINVKMPTIIVGILTSISRIYDMLWSFQPEIFTDSGYFSIYEQF